MSSEQRVIFNKEAAMHLFQGNGCWSDAQKDWVRPEEATVYTPARLDAWPADQFPSWDGEASRVMSVEDARACCDAFLTAEQLDEIYNPEGGGEHPDFTREDWRQEVANEDTLCGYWHQCMSWLQVRSEDIEEAERAASAPAPGVG